MENKNKKLIVIMGPTASGKTALGIELARMLNGEIISGDAFQVYKGLDIGTAKPTLEERKLVRHHFLDCKEATEGYTVAEFTQVAKNKIMEINQNGKVPIVVGGTGLYIQALIEGYSFSETGPLRERYQELEEIYNREGISGLTARMKELDPDYLLTHSVLDKQRLIRALAILEKGDTYKTTKKSNKSLYNGPVFALLPTREILYKRINARVDIMIELGLEREAEWLWQLPVEETVQARKAIGYSEWEDYFNKTISLIEVAERIKRNTRHFAKRQITWLKRMNYVEYVDPEEYPSMRDLAETLLPIIENKWRNSK